MKGRCRVLPASQGRNAILGFGREKYLAIAGSEKSVERCGRERIAEGGPSFITRHERWRSLDTIGNEQGFDPVGTVTVLPR
jgi:hypothetical protein